MKNQLKCTSSINKYRNEKECIFYTLPVKNYNDLASKGMPILLMLLVLPENEKAMILTKEQLLMKGTMYYLNLQGGKKSENKESVTISIPYCNIVNEEVLNFLLMRAGDGSL